jgi:hypothetical protein
MPTSTYEIIEAKTVGTAVASVTFSSIPATYTDLVLVTNNAGNLNNDPTLRVNGDTGSNYSVTHLTSNGSALAGYRFGGQTSFSLNYFGGDQTVLGTNARIIYIHDYVNTSKYKGLTCTAGHNDTTDGLTISVGQWRSNSAITSVTFLAGSGKTLSVNSRLSLYGIKAGS